METCRTKDIKSFLVMDVLERACCLEREGKDIIHLEIGEPDFDTPEPIKEATVKALHDGRTHYTHSLGIIELREAVCDHYYKRYNVSITPDQVVVTGGTSPAMFLLFAALLEAGDEVITTDPHYACYPSFIRFADGRHVPVRVYEEDGFQYRVEEVKKRITPRTKGIFVNSPANPTGNMIPPERLEQLTELGVPVISDEIYHGLVYGEEGRRMERSVLEFSDEAYVFNGFSKLYAMTGMRLGYLIGPKDRIKIIQRLAQNFLICANAPAQWAGIAALTQCEEYTARMREVYNERRVFLIQRLREIGFGITVEPKGAFYVLANAKHYGEDSLKLAYDILENACVGVTPGIDFGPGAEGYIRFSYANSLENIAEGMNRLERYIRERFA